MDAGRILLQVKTHWNYSTASPVMIAVSSGPCCTAPDPLVQDQGVRHKQGEVDTRVNIDLATFPGPPRFLQGPWVSVHGGSISGADIVA